MQVIKKNTLSTVVINGEVGAYVFDGSDHGVSTSAFIVDVPADLGPRRHKHPYEEIFIIVEGSVRIEADGETVDAGTDDICVVPADTPHAFSNLGPGRARMVNIHAAPKVVTEFVAGGPENIDYHYNHSS
ncbi:cupin domain-containing protein [Actinophytocola sp.]|uniref:cupin domain-containing protein n=1 Tax=Actinophytocola sp. TaxID=1872138 RepID=UPI002ED18AF9